MEEFDINKVTAEFLSSQMKYIIELGKDFLKESTESIKQSMGTIYKRYSL